jgi:hypothetical protein
MEKKTEVKPVTVVEQPVKKTEVKTVTVVEQPVKKPEPNPNNNIGIACFVAVGIVLLAIVIYKKAKGKK